VPRRHARRSPAGSGGDGHALPVGALAPEEIAAATAFLAEPEARHISGVTLDVSAGRSAQLPA